MKTIILQGDATKLYDSIGEYLDKNIKIYVPAGTLDSYKKECWYIKDQFVENKVGTVFNAPIDGLNYSFEVTSYNSVTVKGFPNFKCPTSSINLPETVTYEGTAYTITAIAGRAFSTYQAIETVSIPAGVETIGADAFNNCINLRSVSFAAGSKLKTIGNGAFVATCFKEITLPTSLTTIEYNAFHSNKSLKSIVIPANVTYIGQDAFCTTTNLEYIILEGANTETVNHGQIAPDNWNVIVGVPAANLEAYKEANALLEGRIFATAEDTKLTDESDNITATLADKLWQPGTLSYTRDLSNKTAGNYVTVCLPFDIDLCSLAKSGNLDAADEIYLLATESGSSDEGNRNLQPVTYKEGGIYKLALGKAEYTGNATSCKVAANSPMLIKLGEKVAQNKSLTFSNSSVLAKSENDLEKLLQPASLDIKAADASVTAPDVDITCGGTFKQYTYDECKDFYTFNTKGTFGPQKKDLGANPFRVYLTIKDKAGEPLKNVNLSAVFGGGSGTTGINGVVSASGAAKSSAIYTLDGRKVATGSYGEVKLPKGIYIVGGKKVVVK